MKTLMDPAFDASDLYSLTDRELDLVEGKGKRGRHALALAVLIKYFQAKGRFPTQKDYIPADLVRCLAHQLEESVDGLAEYDWQGSTHKRHRKQVRELFGFRVACAADVGDFKRWVTEELAAHAYGAAQEMEMAYAYFRERHIEPFSEQKVRRHIQSAGRAFEDAFFKSVFEELPVHSKQGMDLLLRGDTTAPKDSPSFRLHDLKKDIKGSKLTQIEYELQRLSLLRSLAIKSCAFQKVPRQFLHKYYLRVMVSTPSRLKEFSQQNRYGMLAVFCHMRVQEMTDGLIDLLIQKLKKVRKNAEVHVNKKAVKEIKPVGGKFDILYTLASVAASNPEGVIKETVYPVVSQQVLLDLVSDLACRKGWYRQEVQKKMHTLYSHAHRKFLFPLVEAFTFRTTLTSERYILKALAFIKRHKNKSSDKYPCVSRVLIEGVIESEWKERVILREEAPGSYKVDKMAYEMAVLESLCRKIPSKLVWVEDSYRYRDPEEDYPSDFDQNKEHYYKMLNLPLESNIFVKSLKERLENALQKFDQTVVKNKQVEIHKGTGKIKLSPTPPQKEPLNIKLLQQAIFKRWKNTTLLDILKETDLRVQFIDQFETAGSKDAISLEARRKRMLLVLFSLGTNTGMTRTGAANADVSYDDLKYTKQRYLHVANVKAAIVKVVNSILAVRDKEIWGEGTTGVACDSTQVRSWDQNLLSQWHYRYHEYGVMVYWHVDTNATVIYSQTKSCASSEVGSMITGVLKHDTEMEMNQVYVDTHGQSVIGFCLSDMLHVELLPRIKRIKHQKLFYSTKGDKENYSNIAPLFKGKIDWNLIATYYHEVVRVVAALKTRTVEADVMIKRFSKDNYNHPVYRAMNEIGKAVKTIFLCRYLMSEALRVEVHEALNVVERLNSIMHFIFYGKLGELRSNQREQQELAIACLHLLQVSMVYINTLIIQEILSSPEWRNRLTLEDKRALTPLIHTHINPYGLFPLDLTIRMEIEGRAA